MFKVKYKGFKNKLVLMSNVEYPIVSIYLLKVTKSSKQPDRKQFYAQKTLSFP